LHFDFQITELWAGRGRRGVSKRFSCAWAGSGSKPAVYHCVTRCVGSSYLLGDGEKEKFRVFMRMQENFSGCRGLSYCGF
jgi:hypothetical protein